MKILNYSDVPYKESLKIENFINSPRLFDKLKQKYGKSHAQIEEDLTRLIGLYKDSIPNISVLDLGCGSMGNSYDHDVIQHARDFEPWLCRALHELGIKVIGIDSGKFRNSLKIRH